MARAIHWTIPFESLEGVSYSVNIYEEDYTGAVITLTGASSPFQTDEDDDDDPFIPIRKQTGYVRFMDMDGTLGASIAPVFAFDRYIELVSGDSVLWQGYIDTGQFSGSFTAPPYEVELPIKSAASMMECSQFSASNDFVRFGALLKKCLDVCKVTWTNIYIPVLENAFSETAVKELLYTVFDGNFVEDTSNDKKHEGINPDLKSPEDGQTYLDILKEICMFCGWSLREMGQELFFVASDATNHYSKIAYSDIDSLSPTVTEVTFSSAEVPVYDDSDHSLDIIPGRSQIRIEAETNPLSGDILGLSVENGDFVRTAGGVYNNGKYGYIAYCYENADRVWTLQTEPGFPAYNMGGNMIYTGACFARDRFYTIDDAPTDISGCEEAITFCGMHGVLGTDEWITIRSARKIAFVATSGSTKLRLTANVTACKHFYGDDFSYNPHCYVNAYLKIGDKYYNGTSWTTTKTAWKLRLGLPGTWSESNDEEKEKGSGCIFTDASPKVKYAEVTVPSGMAGRIELSFCVPDSPAASYQYIRFNGLQLTVQDVMVSYYNERYELTKRLYNKQLNSGYTEVYTSKRKLGGGHYNGMATVLGTQLTSSEIDFYRVVDISQAYLDRLGLWYNRTIPKLTLTVKRSSLTPSDRYIVNKWLYLLGGVKTNWIDDSQEITLYRTVVTKSLEMINIYSDDLSKDSSGRFVIRKSGYYEFKVEYTPADTTDVGVNWTFTGLIDSIGYQISDGQFCIHTMPAGTTGFTVKATSTVHPTISRTVQVILIP